MQLATPNLYDLPPTTWGATATARSAGPPPTARSARSPTASPRDPRRRLGTGGREGAVAVHALRGGERVRLVRCLARCYGRGGEQRLFRRAGDGAEGVLDLAWTRSLQHLEPGFLRGRLFPD